MGEKIYVPALLGLFGEELSVEAVSNAKCVEIQRMDYNGAVEVLAKEPGEPKLHISYKDLNTDIVLTIQGILADQEVGEDYPVEIESIGSISSSAFDLDTALILDSNHQLWELYPEVVKKKDNVKAYVANWVYYGPGRKDAEVCTYLLDNNKILWNDTEKLAANVERFDGRYALDTQGVLHNVYNSGNEQIENVEDWSSPTYLDKGIVYILKKDGTLWKRQETARDQKAGQWEKVDSGVKQLYKINHYSLDGGYLKTDGTIVAFDGTETTDIKADHMGEKGSFYDKEGNYYFYDWEEYINLGKIDVKQAKLCRGSEEIILLLDQAGKAYKYDVQTKKQELLATDVMKINENFSYWPESTAWAFQLTNGKYCDGNGNAMKEAKIGSSGYSYSLIWHDDGSQEVVRNGVPILSKVTAVWGERIEGEWITFACRTDGTVWNITGVPKLVLDLKTSTYIKGDVNEDREVNIKDLQIVLRGVCEKIELTARQKMIADVVEDGEVDIQDLRKELRFVCGKIESL
ncbi:MAG: dockerin type I repeat-containing protein [Lachnospiraceae bacterium]